MCCALGGLTVLAAQGQVFWNETFDSPSAFCFSTETGSGALGDVFPTITATNVDIGAPHGHVLRVNVDASRTQFAWTISHYLSGCPGTAPSVTFNPTNTFIKFDALVSQPRPLHVRLEYNALGMDNRNLNLDVNLNAAAAFQTFALRLSDFADSTNIISGKGFPQFPSAMIFGIRGDPADPANTWPMAADNMFMVDNLSYIIEPALSIAAWDGGVVVSWPTNASGFVLQQSVDLNNWAVVTNVPVASSNMNQVIMGAEGTQSFYRLGWP